ncbi:MAG TPA: hypothetical protein VF411_12990, partial [Bacteroidia bacterium]
MPITRLYVPRSGTYPTNFGGLYVTKCQIYAFLLNHPKGYYNLSRIDYGAFGMINQSFGVTHHSFGMINHSFGVTHHSFGMI